MSKGYFLAVGLCLGVIIGSELRGWIERRAHDEKTDD